MKGTPTPPGRIRSQAKNALFFSSNWISALFATFSVLLLIWGSFFLVDSILWAASYAVWIPYIADAAAYVLLYLLLSPLVPGLVGYYADLFRASRGEGAARVAPNVVFACYAGARTIVRAWGQVLLQLLLWASVPGVFVLSAAAAAAIPEKVVTSALPVGFAVGIPLSVILLLCALYANARLGPALFLSVTLPELSFAESIRISLRMTRAPANTAVIGQLRLLVLSLLSLLLTAGIGYVLYVLPMTVFLYIGYSSDTVKYVEY